MKNKRAGSAFIIGLLLYLLVITFLTSGYRPAQRDAMQIAQEFSRFSPEGYTEVVQRGRLWFRTNTYLPNSPGVARYFLAALAQTGEYDEMRHYAEQFCVIYADDDREVNGFQPYCSSERGK